MYDSIQTVSILSNLEKLNKIIREFQGNCRELLVCAQHLIANEQKKMKEKEAQITQFYNVFVYCGGKCGSSTLQNTFANNNYEAIHAHGYMEFTSNNITYTIYDLMNVSAKKYETIYIIDSYRTPIERKISSFFQNIQAHLSKYKDLTLTELIIFFNTNCIYTLEGYHTINQGLTHYQVPLFTTFDFEKGYNLIKKDNKVFIKILFKDIDKWDTILSNIFQKTITIYSDNLTQNKPNYLLYKEFLKEYKVPKAYLEHLKVNDTEFKIYNSKSAQKAYLTKWKKNSL